MQLPRLCVRPAPIQIRNVTSVRNQAPWLAAIHGLFSHGPTEMAITELLSIRARKGIACFGDAPLSDDELAFRDRGFLVSSCTDEELQSPAYLAGLSAVVFTQSAD